MAGQSTAETASKQVNTSVALPLLVLLTSLLAEVSDDRVTRILWVLNVGAVPREGLSVYGFYGLELETCRLWLDGLGL